MLFSPFQSGNLNGGGSSGKSDSDSKSGGSGSGSPGGGGGSGGGGEVSTDNSITPTALSTTDALALYMLDTLKQNIKLSQVRVSVNEVICMLVICRPDSDTYPRTR